MVTGARPPRPVVQAQRPIRNTSLGKNCPIEARLLEELPETSDEVSEALAVLTGISREPIQTGVISLQTNVSSVGSGQLAVLKVENGPTPVSKCNLRNTQKSDCTFRCIGTGKTYTLKPGQSMSFTIYGRVTPKPIPKASIGVLAVSTTALNPNKVDFPYLEFYTYSAGKHFVVVPNGNLDITMSTGFYRLKKRAG